MFVADDSLSDINDIVSKWQSTTICYEYICLHIYHICQHHKKNLDPIAKNNDLLYLARQDCLFMG
jgi:hypothetical protein